MASLPSPPTDAGDVARAHALVSTLRPTCEAMAEGRTMPGVIILQNMEGLGRTRCRVLPRETRCLSILLLFWKDWKDWKDYYRDGKHGVPRDWTPFQSFQSFQNARCPHGIGITRGRTRQRVLPSEKYNDDQ